MQTIKTTGILDFTPDDRTKKHESQSVWKRVAMIRTNCDIAQYYAWFLKNRFDLTLNKPLRGTHITFISDRVDKTIFDQASKVFNGKNIDFFYNPSDIQTNGNHWWIKVDCPDAKSIRQTIGLNPDPYFSFHLTLGYANERNAEHSQYIKKVIEKFKI